MSQSNRIDIINLGDELLLGIRDNTHLSYLGKILAEKGLKIAKSYVIRDEREDIRDVFLQSWNSADLVITTGGLGPTIDDITRETIAECLGLPLVLDAGIKSSIEKRFEKLGRRPTSNNWRQAHVPEGADPIPNAHGTAPGIWLKKDGRLLVMLPGPPHELHPMFENQVLPRLIKEGFIFEELPYLQVRTAGVGESFLERRLKPALSRFPGRLSVAFCAHSGVVDVRLSSVGHSLTGDEIAVVGDQCREILKDDFVCFGNGCSAELVIEQLLRLGKKLAVAESCTGGLLASALTDVPGASKAFAGGIVSYTNDAKIQVLEVPETILQQHGAVSAETAVAMATGAAEKLSADYALSVTGYAGPEGGTEENPVGTVYFGYSSPVGAWSHRMVFPGSRMMVKERAVGSALDWLRRLLQKYEIEDLLASLS